MARTINQVRKINAKLGSVNVDTYGKNFAAKYDLDGASIINVTVQNANPTAIDFIEGNSNYTLYALGSNIDTIYNYALASFPNLKEVYLFKDGAVSISDHLSYLTNLRIMYVNQDYLSSYSWFTTEHSGYENFTTTNDYVSYVVVFESNPVIVTNDNKDNLSIIAGTTIAYDRYLTNINENYPLVISGPSDVELTEAIINNQLFNGIYESENRIGCTKLVIQGFVPNSVDNAVWGYNFSNVLTNLSNNIWYNSVKYDFTTRELSGVDELLESDITNLINGISSDKLSLVTQLKFSGFSDMSAALTYDYSALPNLEYVWLDNAMYEMDNLPRLPSGYQEVEYIEDRGEQYINSNVKPTQNTKVECVYLKSNNTFGFVYGSRTDANSSDKHCFYDDDNTRSFPQFSSYASQVIIPDKTYNVKNIIENGKDGFYFNGTKIIDYTYQDFQSNLDMYIFGLNQNGSLDFRTLRGKLYKFQVIENNILIRDFVPCYRKIDNVIGLYDLVNGFFYTNAGSGTFLKGNNIDYATYFYPISDLVSEYDATKEQTFYLDYNGTFPTLSEDYTYTWYSDINCTTAILPENMISGNRYYAKAVMVTLTIQGSGTLTSAIVENAVSKAGSGVTKVVIPVDFTSYASGSITELQAFMNTNSIDKLVTTYDAGAMELSLSGDIVAKINDIGKTLDEVLIATRSYVSGSPTSLNIVPPCTFSSVGDYYFTGGNIILISNTKITGSVGSRLFASQTNIIEVNIEFDSKVAPNNWFQGTTGIKRINFKFNQGAVETNSIRVDATSIEKIILNGFTGGFWSPFTMPNMTKQSWIETINSLGIPTTRIGFGITNNDIAKLTDTSVDDSGLVAIQTLYDKNYRLDQTATFSFNIGSDTYSCDFGMTWEQWIASAYNIDEYTDIGYICDSNGYPVQLNGVNVTDGDMIKYGDTYTIGNELPTAKVCKITNLGSENPSNVVFTKSANFPTENEAWEEQIIGTDYFAKFTKWYKKVIANSNNNVVGMVISDTKIDDNYHLYDCFVDENGNELPYILIGEYCISSTTTANSVDATATAMAISFARTLARAKGNGYQIMDASMYMFWRDLALAISENVNFNNGSGVSSYLGLKRMNEVGWLIDGISINNSTYYYSNKPSKYINSPTSSSDGYTPLSYTAPSGHTQCIKSLGYDNNNPTINFGIGLTGNSNYGVYYCDAYYYRDGGNNPIHVSIGEQNAMCGLFHFGGHVDWNYQIPAKLCYRPIGGN